MTQSSNSSILIINLAAFSLVFFANLFSPQPLESVRPEMGRTVLQPAHDSGILQAREWEDPIEVIRNFQPRHEENTQPAAPHADKDRVKSDADTLNAKTLNQAILDLRAHRDNDVTKSRELVLPIFLRGDTYPESREMRLRSRYATQAALTSLGYRTVKSNQLYYLTLRKSSAGKNGSSHPNCPLGMEIFTMDPAGKDTISQQLPSTIYIFWVDSADFDVADLIDIASLPAGNSVNTAPATTQHPLLPLIGCLLNDPTKPQVRVIHLGSSDALASLLRSLIKKDAGSLSKLAHNFWFPRATVSRSRLADLAKDEKVQLINLKRPAVTDEQLVDSLIQHLDERIPNFDPLKDVAFVTEWDTGYARGMISEWVQKAERLTGSSETGQLRVFAYLRGLDGNRSGSSKDSKSSANAGPTLELLKGLHLTGKTAEQLADTTQFDYLRRLISSLSRSSNSLRRPRAIGIIGSDVYDKITVLQAIKPLLPEAVFFTTDLDQQFLHPNTSGAAKNLLVASSQDLEPEPLTSKGRQWKFGTVIPPYFRDIYQCHLFDSLIHAIQSVDPQANTALSRPSPSEAVVVEVGNHRFHKKPTPGNAASSIFSRPLGSDSAANLLIWLPGLSLFFLGCWICRRGLSRTLRKIEFLSLQIFIVLLVPATLIGIATEVQISRDSDIWSMTLDGTSPWGSLAFIAIAAVSSYFGIRSLHEGMTPSQLGPQVFNTAEESLKDACNTPASKRTPWLPSFISLSKIFITLIALKDARTPEAVQALYDSNHIRGNRTSLPITCATVPGAFFLLAAAASCALHLHPSHLYNSAFAGALGHWTEYIVMTLTVISFVWLAFALVNWHLFVVFSANHWRRSVENNWDYSKGCWSSEAADHRSRLLRLNELFSAMRQRIWFAVTSLIFLALSQTPVFKATEWTLCVQICLCVLVILLLTATVWAWLAMASYKGEIEWCIDMHLERGLEAPNQAPQTGEDSLSSVSPEERKLRHLLEDLRAQKSGAFESWYRQPVFLSMFTLIAGLGSLQALDPLVKMLRGH